MNTNTLIALGLVGGGALYLLSRPESAWLLNDLGLGPGAVSGALTPAQLAAVQLRQGGAGNAPVVSSSPFISSPQGIAGIATIGASLLPLFGLGGVALGITTAGIGLAVTFVTYELLKQRASMHTNDVRDAWQRQFIALHDALGLTPLRADQTRGSGPGNMEMLEVLFYFDHDSTYALWTAASHTQDENTFRRAAANIDRFLTAHGVPVQDV